MENVFIPQGIPPPLCEPQIPEKIQTYKETIERNHTHCILFDSGRLNEYLSDSQRDRFVTEACKDTDDGDTCMYIFVLKNVLLLLKLIE